MTKTMEMTATQLEEDECERLEVAENEEIDARSDLLDFKSRWSTDQLRAVDPALYEQMKKQHETFQRMVGEGTFEERLMRAARMRQKWRDAVHVMEMSEKRRA